MDDNSERLLTVAEVAERMGRSIEQVRRYLREGKLSGRRIGQQWFVEANALARESQTMNKQEGERQKPGKRGPMSALEEERRKADRAMADETKKVERIGEAAAAYMARPDGGTYGARERSGSMEKPKMNKDEIEKLIADVTALRERIRARRGGDHMPMTAAQLVRLDRDEH